MAERRRRQTSQLSRCTLESSTSKCWLQPKDCGSSRSSGVSHSDNEALEQLRVEIDGAVEPSLVWKDTVLVRTGETVDVLLDVTNPGRWMAHCHIAEHHESGMMFSFNVTDPD